MVENQIVLKTITEILGENFYIPDYQRGYRWTKQNVTQLLEDVWEYRQEKSNANTFYCLQPVVVRKKSWTDEHGNTIEGYELIDGQQRLTTIHRILHYLITNEITEKRFLKKYKNGLYNLYYKTRPETKSFLETEDFNDTKPDLYYLSEAYKTIENWFDGDLGDLGFDGVLSFFSALLPNVSMPKTPDNFPEWSVQVIWYEINDDTQKSEELFTRLNRGKIPLTSAELIKAKFVNEDSFKTLKIHDRIKRRTLLIQIWDEIEHQLNNPKFWAFISNAPLEKYSNKIEYLFDITTGKTANEADPLFSFLHFFGKKETAESLWDKWIKIEDMYRALQYWYSNKNMYHKIGYLITVGTKVADLVNLKQQQTKDKFEAEVNKLIEKSIPDNWEGLVYDSKNTEKIIHTLLLTNVELTRKNENINDFFPFETYKKIDKSLEHIHAQNIEGINENKKEEWISWLNAHTEILPFVIDKKDKQKVDDLIKESEDVIPKITYAKFEELSKRILALIPKEEGDANDYLHQIQNLALLGIVENISLSNSVFEVKRRKIINLDKNGAFIPLATRRVFLNYYSSDQAAKHSLWTKTERDNYLQEITDCLTPYLISKNEEDEA